MNTPAKFYNILTNNNLQCTLCPRECIIPNNKHGFCKVRYNNNGKLYTNTYASPAAIAIDPIEKKPLYHFLPTTKITSIGTYGCNLDCKACQNWQLARNHNPKPFKNIPPQQIVDYAIENNTPSIAFTYNEPTVFAEYLIEIAQIASQYNIKNVMVSNGYTHQSARPEIYRNIHAANIDLKAITDNFYKSYANAHLEPILNTLKYLKNETNIHIELTTLIIPTLNDQHEHIKQLSNWICENLSPNIPLHLSAYYPNYKLNIPPTQQQSLYHLQKIAQNEGLNFVYLGNTPDDIITYCPNCKTPLISRSFYHTTILNLDKNTCNNCKHTIYGFF